MLLPIVVLSVVPIEARQALDVSQVTHDDGFAYLAVSPEGRRAFGILEMLSDSSRWPERSSLHLLEDGRTLGPAHALHQAIREEGAGRYSHWSGNLYFSSSDNTDPRTNHRVYEVAGLLAPSFLVYVVGLILTLLAIGRAGLFRHPEIRRRLRTGLTFLFERTDNLKLPRWIGYALLFAGFLAGPAAVFVVWRSGVTISLSLAGLLPLSDAGGYFWCANDLIDKGTTSEWCHRRPLYTVFLSSLTMIFGRDLHLTLLAQAALLSLSVTVFMREVSRWLGMLLGLAAGVTAIYLVAGYALTQVASEAMGLILGLSSLTILLRAGASRAPNLALVGLVILSVALNARPGAVFALPAVVLWIGWMAWGRGHWRYLAMALGAVGIGFLIHGLLVYLVGGMPGGSHGNFAVVLYGLSVGGDWMTFYADHPGIFEPSVIYDMAIANIANDPGQLIHSLVRNLNHYFGHVLISSIPARWPVITTGWPIVDVGAVYVVALGVTAWRARQDLRAALVLAVCVGEIASAPLVSYDGGLRALVVTAATQVLPILVMIHAVVTWLFRMPPVGLKRLTDELDRMDWPKVPLVITAIIGLLWIPPLTPLKLLARALAQPGASCAPGLYAIATRLDAGGPWLTLTSEATRPQVWPRRIGLDDFRHGIKPSTWFAESVLNLPPMAILIVRQHLRDDYGTEHYLYYSGASELPIGKTLLFCADQNKPLYIAQRAFWEIVSFREL